MDCLDVFLMHASCIFDYFLQWSTNVQLIDKLYPFHMFRHYHFFLREFVDITLLSYTNMSNAAAGNAVYNLKLFPIGIMLLKYQCLKYLKY